ncbi:hypothetical protein A3J56_01640 [Candidatus Giovannonibacteria bacterium RIFCSPHIGHO2_02_FULL_46_20]|uniref:Uncharacterized protein n=1 Tax=Candidatus Giovannonibacteria bacterium RIFCSPHIGHO2_02_FULL_46_20 TaxID=1798338 RepID=A0A1F5WEH4_9BACT|nr:MAG: hypothetical protein A3J56_01640 [Candidatus Giovannonibacteria bacterium RIFCSPHIGHO2_02_FULL_46_20]
MEGVEQRRQLDRFLEAWNQANHLLGLDYKKINEQPELVAEVLEAIQNVIGPKLKSEKSFMDALFILNPLAEYYDSPDTMVAATDVLSKNLGVIEQHVGNIMDINRQCFLAANNLISFGSNVEKEAGKHLLETHIDEIIDGMERGRSYEFIPFLEKIMTIDPEHPNEEAEIKISEYLKEHPRDFRSIAFCLMSSYKPMRDMGEKTLENRIAEYGLPPTKSVEAWVASTKKFEADLATILYNTLFTLEGIEEARPGIARFLYTKFGILDFNRYSPELLIRQYDEYENKELPYGVIFYPRADHNGAFYQNQQALSELSQQLQGQFAIRIGEGESKLDIVRLLRKLNKQYGNAHKISFAIIGGHGTKDSIQFGNKAGDRYQLHIEDLQDPRVNKQSYFEEHPTLILVSCSTGFEGGIGQELSRLLGATVIAPKQDTNIKKIETQIDENGVHFGVEYFEEKSQAVYYAGQKQ